MRRSAGIAAIALVVLAGVSLLAVFPTRTFLAQRSELRQSEQRLAVLRDQNRDMAKRVAELHTDAEIERLAREQYNLVRPGEEAYAILPGPEKDKPVKKALPPPKKETFWDRLRFWS